MTRLPAALTETYDRLPASAPKLNGQHHKAAPRLRRSAKWEAFRALAFSGTIAELGKNERGLLLYLFAIAKDDGTVEAGTRLIAGATGIGRSGISRAFGWLKSRGIVQQLAVGRSKASRSKWQLLPVNRMQRTGPVDGVEQGAIDGAGSGAATGRNGRDRSRDEQALWRSRNRTRSLIPRPEGRPECGDRLGADAAASGVCS